MKKVDRIHHSIVGTGSETPDETSAVSQGSSEVPPFPSSALLMLGLRGLHVGIYK